jgi:hypothetical protein
MLLRDDGAGPCRAPMLPMGAFAPPPIPGALARCQSTLLIPLGRGKAQAGTRDSVRHAGRNRCEVEIAHAACAQPERQIGVSRRSAGSFGWVLPNRWSRDTRWRRYWPSGGVARQEGLEGAGWCTSSVAPTWQHARGPNWNRNPSSLLALSVQAAVGCSRGSPPRRTVRQMGQDRLPGVLARRS